MNNATTGKSEGFNNGTSGTSIDYNYDANGNMISDLNKNITSIDYNHLNLPTKIKFNNSETKKIEYLYNAAGQKVKKTVTDGTTIKAVDYLDGFQYAGSVLQFFPHPEGYVKATAATPTNTSYYYDYVYNYTDHLGNVRLSYSKDPLTNQLKIMDETHYYPFGMEHKVYVNPGALDFKTNTDTGNGTKITNVLKTDYLYKFNGKEYQDELGLGWYDYQARNYDPALGRWFNIDPAAELMRRHSPYTYVYNNPLRFIDPDGMMGDDVIIKGDLADKAFTQLESETSLSLTHDKTSGKVETNDLSNKEYKNLSKGDQKLYDAIKDKGKTVELTATSANEINVNGVDKILVLGSYEGSKLSGDGQTIIGDQYVNPDQAEKVEANGGNTAGQIVKHEVLESYIAMGIGNGVHNINSQNGYNTYIQAHGEAKQLDQNYSDGIIKKDPGRSVPGYNIYFMKNTSTGNNVEIFRVKQ